MMENPERPMATIYYTATSLDGFIADEQDGLDWLLRLTNPDESGFASFLAGIGAIAMGGNTYRWLLQHHRNPDGSRAAWPYAVPGWIFSRREIEPYPGADLRRAHGPVQSQYPAMRDAAAGKHLWIVGGGDLAGQFFDAQLLDQLHVTVASVTLGRGKPLLPRRIENALRLEQAKPMGASFVELTYRVSYPS